jgi:hypothetical protein
MTSPPLPVVDVNVHAADASMDAVAERVVALLEQGVVRIVDFASDAADQSTIRAVGYPGDPDAH